MALLRSLILYNGSDSLPAVDYTNDTDWTQTELATMANLGDAAAGQWLVRDETGVIPDFVSPGKFLESHNVIVATVGSNTLFRGRVAQQDQFRGRQKAGRASEWQVTLEDQNSHLRGIVVDNWVRPAETDRARALALVTAYLNGSPRATTVLATNLIHNSNTISLPAKTYSGVTPYEIMQELAANADKEMFVTIDNELAYFGHDYGVYASSLRISDDLADANSLTFAPINVRSSEFGRQKLTALRVYYGPDTTTQTTQLTNTFAPQYDYWEDVFWDSQSATNAQALARAQKQLDYRSVDDVSYSCQIGPMTGDEVWRIKPGHQIQFKARAARSGRNPNGTFTGDSFLTTRVREIHWTMPAEDVYFAQVDLERPKRTSAPGVGSQALTVMQGRAVPGATVGSATYEAANSWRAQHLITIPATNLAWTNNLTAGAIYPLLFSGLLYDDSDDSRTRDHYFMSWLVNAGTRATAGSGGPWYISPGSYTGTFTWELVSTYWGTGQPEFEPPGHIVASGSFTNPVLGDQVAIGTFEVPITSGRVQLYLRTTFPDITKLTRVWIYGPAASPSHIGTSFVTLDTPTAYYGESYGPVPVAVADGVTSSWTLPYPSAYKAGTLNVEVDGIWQTVSEDDPTTGLFSLGWTPGAGDQISASWRVPLNI